MLASLLAAYMRLIKATTRWDVRGRDVMGPLWETETGMIGALWHGNIMMALSSWPMDRQTPGFLISRSPDGAFVAGATQKLGAKAMRGSTKNTRKSKEKGGSAALRQMIRHVDDGGLMAITPDGPRGPRGEAGMGAIKLAQLTGAPIVALGVATRWRIVFKTWDRLCLPLPFGRGTIVWAGPISVPKNADTAALESKRQQLETCLSQASAEAERACHPHRPLALSVYRIATQLFAGFAKPWLQHRVHSDKEDAARLGERLGRTSIERPKGTLVWVHGASVGETDLALNLIQTLHGAKKDIRFLLTTGTQTSADLAARRMKSHTRHQYLPLDIPDAVDRFLTHWQPELGVFVESELWPNLITAAEDKRIKLALVNARMNATSLRRWHRAPASAKHLLNAFDWIGTADETTRKGLATLTDWSITQSGNLKLSAPPPTADQAALKQLKSAFGARPVWLALSTHEGEDQIILNAHKRILTEHPQAVLILVPRHPERASEIARLCANALLISQTHSSGKTPNADSSVYIGDSIGDMGLWLRLASPAFIGGSLLPDLSGHNPLEAVRLNVPVLSGPHRASFDALYASLADAGGAKIVTTETELATAILSLWVDLKAAKTMTDAAQTLIDTKAKAPMDITRAALLDLIKDQS